MESSISLRIRQIIAELFGGNNSKFARTVGISESVVRSYLTNTTPKADVLEKIAANSAISCEWLLLGRGEMLYSNSPVANQTNDALLLTIIKEKDAKIEEQAKTIGRLEERVETLSKKSIDISDVEDVECVAASG